MSDYDEPEEWVDPVESGDLDGVLREIDNLVDQREWLELARLRRRCLVAFERGHQLWPAANAAAYRLALHGPGELAAEMALADDVRFTLGPLTEVVAQHHGWDELDSYLPDGPVRAAIAQECVVRGADLSEAAVDAAAFGLPLTLQGWEPTYAVASYREFEADFPSPSVAPLLPMLVPAGSTRLPDDDVVTALRSVVSAWTEQSTGRAEVVAVDGTAEEAIAALGVPGASAADVSVGEALAHLAWAAASGGAQGRRRGMAAGRFEAWWTVAAATNLLDDWPVEPDLLREEAEQLRWVLWQPGHNPTGWDLHLAIEDPGDDLAWALSATDQS